MARTITITRDAFIEQGRDLLPHIGGGLEKEARAELRGMWDRLVGTADEATLYLRGYDEDYGYWRAALVEKGFYGQYLPIAESV